MNTEDNKPKLGRPRVYTDAERTARAKASAKKSAKKHGTTTIAMRGEDLDRLRELKEVESAKLGFSLTNQQFFKLLFKSWEENHKG